MSDRLTLHEITLSPNNVKARVALGYKGLEYHRKPLEFTDYPGDRAGVVQVSRQPRLPVLEHGKTVIFGSDGIMRYLEANFPDTPPLFVQDHTMFGEVERWELFARTQLGEPVSLFFGQAFSPSKDPAVIQKANELLHQRTAALEDRLSTSEFLVGDHLTAADVACASPLYMTDQTEELAASHPIATFFHENMHLGEERDKTRAWMRRVLKHDPVTAR